jgi:hypothetical protein
MLYLGQRTAGTTVYVPFHTFNSSGASVTISGLAVTDIEIYKNGSTTQRASDNGYTLLDTDGIDYDGLTGLHGFSIDLSDNSDTGFFSAGNFYMVAVSSITADGQTVSFWAACFDIVSAAATLADINAEVVDALATDTYAEPGQGTPGATVSLKDKIGYLYKFARNRVTQTSTTLSYYNDDATTVDHKATVADDGTTASRTELTTGP